MRLLLVCFLLLGTLLPTAVGRNKSGKLRDVEVVEFTAVRDESQILIDGVIVVHRKSPIHGLIIQVNLLAPGNQLISERKVTVSEDLLEAGDEVPFSLAGPGQARAVSVSLTVFSAKHRPLTITNPGPYPIE